ncbi:UDP-N-acetylmuramate dehydrogenase [Desulfocurvus sp. DL9XJH121]
MGLKVLPGPLMRERTTLGLGGPALAEVRIHSERGLDELPAVLEKIGGRPLVMGWGSNLLAADGELPVTLIGLPEAGRPRVVRESGERVTVHVDAGMRLPRLLAWCAKHDLAGLAGLSGIPGGVGGAVAMNAGSFGADMAGCVSRVLLFSPCCGLRWAGRADVDMGYRHFEPRTWDSFFIVLAVELDLARAEAGSVLAHGADCLARKKATQPLAAKSAGCVFKNPEGDAAGRLLERAGLKGQRLGDMAFSDLHANFLVNLGGGTAAQAFELIEAARGAVAERFGVELELEVRVVA